MCQSQGEITPLTYSDLQKNLPGTTGLSVNQLVHTELLHQSSPSLNLSFSHAVWKSFLFALKKGLLKDTDLKSAINVNFN